MENQTAIIIGRFQVPYLHLGHIALIAYGLQNYTRVVILLGTALYMDDRNRYGFTERAKSILRIFPQVTVEPLFDVPGDDKTWSEKVDTIIRNYNYPVLLHSRDSFKSHYQGKFETEEIPEVPGYSGTELRKGGANA